MANNFIIKGSKGFLFLCFISIFFMIYAFYKNYNLYGFYNQETYGTILGMSVTIIFFYMLFHNCYTYEITNNNLKISFLNYLKISRNIQNIKVFDGGKTGIYLYSFGFLIDNKIYSMNCYHNQYVDFKEFCSENKIELISAEYISAYKNDKL